MKSHRSSSKSGLFLIELIIAIVFFAVSSAICMRLFVSAHLVSEQSKNLSAANAILQTEAELFKRDRQNASGEAAFYSAWGRKTDREGALYRVNCEITHDAGLSTATYRVFRVDEQGEPIAELTVAAYERENR